MYKNIIISIFAFLFASNLMAEDCSLMSCDDTSHKHSYVVNADGNFKKNYEVAKLLAKQQNKKLFVYVYTTRCRYCIKQSHLMDESMAFRLSIEKDYVVFKINKDLIDKDNEFYARFVPSMFILNSDGVTLEEIYGLTPMDEMLDIFEQLKEL